MKLVAAIALAAALFGPAAAQASPAFDAFESVCVSTRGQHQAALAKADASGWMQIPDVLMKTLRQDFPGGEGRMRSDAGGLYLLIVGAMNQRMTKSIDLKLKICAVAAMPPPTRGVLEDEIARYAAVAPEPGLSKREDVGYVFTEKDGVHTRVADMSDAVVKGLLSSGEMRLVLFRADKEMAMVAYAIPEI